jgi:hypothetical protein
VPSMVIVGGKICTFKSCPSRCSCSLASILQDSEKYLRRDKESFLSFHVVLE